MTKEEIDNLWRVAEEKGIIVPGDRPPAPLPFAPTIDVTQPISTLALEIGRLIAKQNIYLKSNAVVQVNQETGDIETMRVRDFPSFLEGFAVFKAPGTRQKRPSLSVEDGAQILETTIFRRCLRPLNGVHTMRLPVRRAGEVFKVEFLEPGYDQETGILTLDLLRYPLDWTMAQGVDWFCDVCSEFPWNGMEEKTPEEQPAALRANRSFAVHVAAMLGSFCRGLFPPGTLRPMLAYFANKPGTGKTRTAEMSLSHVYGLVGGTTAPKDEDKMDVKLETVARAMLPWVIYDDIGGALRSNALNKFLTEARHTGRCYNSNSEFFNVPNVTQVFVTANELPTSEDLGRRALVAEFFLADEVRGRRFKRFITASWLAEPEVRGKFLAACCALVKHWMAPTNHYEPMPMHPAPLESFELWTGTIGAMVMLAGLADPLQPAEKDVGGASVEDEMRTLLIKMAELKGVDCEVGRAELVELAREHGLIENCVGAAGDAPPDASQNKRFGRQIQRWRGQKLQTAAGRRFQFDRKKKSRNSAYPLVFLS